MKPPFYNGVVDPDFWDKNFKEVYGWCPEKKKPEEVCEDKSLEKYLPIHREQFAEARHRQQMAMQGGLGTLGSQLPHVRVRYGFSGLTGGLYA